MNTKSKITVALIIANVFSLLFFGFVAAATFQLSGRVTDQSGNPFAGSIVEVITPSTGTVVASTTANADGNYAVSVAEGTYDVQVTPPAGSGLAPVVALSHTINADTTLDFILVPAGQVSVRGRVLDGQGTPIALRARVGLYGVGGNDTLTDASGNFLLRVAPGSYPLSIDDYYVVDGFDPSIHAPRDYFLVTQTPLQVLQDTDLGDIILPIRQLDVHVQDSAGNPAANVSIYTAGPDNREMTLLGLPTTGSCSSLGNTDASGNITLWLFPNAPGAAYRVWANPPSGSPLPNKVVDGVVVTSDTALTITLETTVSVRGRVLDGQGTPIALRARVGLYGVGGNDTLTDASGNFLLRVAPGSYPLSIDDYYVVDGFDPSIHAPRDYFLVTQTPLQVLQDTDLGDIILPIRQLDVHVQDSAGNPAANVSIYTAGPDNREMTLLGLPTTGSCSSLGNTDASGNITLWLFPNAPGAAYRVWANPPSGSPLPNKVVDGVVVTSDTALTITLETTVSVRGRVLDGQGTPIALRARVGLYGVGGNDTLTDASGNFLLRVAPGSYPLSIDDYYVVDGFDPSIHAPRDYFLVTQTPLQVLQDTDLGDIVLPVHRLDVHVQDSAGNPVAGVSVGTTGPDNRQMTLLGLPTTGSSSSLGNTDASGNVAFWLFPNAPGAAYRVWANPPSGSPFANFVIEGVVITSDRTLIVVLQFVHDPPVTTISLSPPPNQLGSYPDPVLATLSASAFPGFTVATTYFSVDSATAQIYSTPFAVAGNGTHTVSYWSVDNLGVIENWKSFTFSITSNQPPTANAGGPYNVNEGDSVAVTASGNDPEGGYLTYAWDLDNDSTFETPGQSVTFSAAGLDGPSSHTLTVRVTDSGGLSATDQATVEVLNIAPTANFANTSGTVTEGGSATLAFSNQSDPSTADTTAGFLYSYDCTDDGTFEVTDSTSPSFLCPYNNAGTFSARGRIKDKDSGFTDYTVEVVVISPNQPPQITPNNPTVTVDEGQTATNSGTVNDPNGDPVTLNASVGTVTNNNDGTWSWNFTTSDGPAENQTVTIFADDGQGGSAQTTFDLIVNNVAPDVGPISAPVDPVQVNTTVNASADFTDPGVLDTHTAVWDWGDGNTSASVVSEMNGSGSVVGDHTYITPGVYTVKVMVTDKDDGSDESVFQFVVVYDPSGGFVTGGGWISSPPGACNFGDCTEDTTGKATFGFVSKYQKGANVPTGQTEFQFKAGNLNFHSSSYEWLVVAGPHAKFKGTGAINGSGNYSFMVTATDGQVNGGGGTDGFRIKIQDAGGVVYDNKMGSSDDSNDTTAIGGGSIVIHDK